MNNKDNDFLLELRAIGSSKNQNGALIRLGNGTVYTLPDAIEFIEDMRCLQGKDVEDDDESFDPWKTMNKQNVDDVVDYIKRHIRIYAEVIKEKSPLFV